MTELTASPQTDNYRSMWERLCYAIQDNRRDVVLGGLFFLVSVLSFCTGYLIGAQQGPAQIIIEQQHQPL